MYRSRYKNLGPLHDLLLEACPPDPDTGTKSIPTLARALGISNWAVYSWIQTSRIPPRRAMQVVDLSRGQVTIQRFHPFIFLD